MSAHPFLSPEWIVAARAIRDEYSGQAPEPTDPVKANLVVTGAPFSDEEIAGHIDTTGSSVIIEEGHLDDAELTVTTDYATAKMFFVDRDPSKAMEAFMLGKILVTGDVAKVLGFASAPPPTDPDDLALAKEIAGRLDEITSDTSGE